MINVKVTLEYLRLLSGQRRLAGAVILFMLVGTAAEILGLFALVLIMGGGGAGRSGSPIAAALAWFTGAVADGIPPLAVGIALFLSSGLMAAIGKYLVDRSLVRLRSRSEEALAGRVLTTFLSLPWASASATRHGRVQKLVLDDSFRATDGAVGTVQSLSMLAAFAIYGVGAVLISPLVAVLSLMLGLTVSLAVRPLLRRGASGSKAAAAINTTIAEKVASVVNNNKLIRQNNREEASTAAIRQAVAGRSIARHRTLNPVVNGRLIFDVIGIAYLLGVMVYMLVIRQAPPGEFVGFVAIFARALPKLGNIHASQAMVLSNYGAAADLNAYLREQAPPVAPASEAEAVPPVTVGIELRGVSYTYGEAGRGALQAVDMRIPAHGLCAIIGESGAGKTTLLDLISGLVEPASGEILVDGRDLRKIPKSSWRQRLAVVPQDSPAFPGSIADNVTWFDSSPDMDRVVTCLIQAGLPKFAERLRDGERREIGDLGAGLSGGERQRLALARALYLRPSLLLLDEPTSGLDAETESDFVKMLDSLKSQMTIVVVTHRPAILRHADVIYTVAAGRVAPKRVA